MVRTRIPSTWLLVGCLFIMGCGAGGPAADSTDAATRLQNQADDSLDNLKTILRQVKETGAVTPTSFFGTDAALQAAGKADLVPQLNQIVASGSADERKSLAAALLSKLE